MLVLTTLSFAQSNEFAKDGNGLIYSDEAIKGLKYVVDSLNLKFSVCEAKTYYALPQGKIDYISFGGKEVASVKIDIDNGLSPIEIERKYDSLYVENSLVVRHIYKDYDNEDVLYFEVLNEEGDYSLTFKGAEFEKYNNVKRGWIYNYSKSSKYSPESITAIYFHEPIIEGVVNEKYTRLIQYSECLIDTTATVYFKSADRSYFAEESGKIHKFINYVNGKIQKQKIDYELLEDESDVSGETMSNKDTINSNLENKRYELYLEAMNRLETNRLIKIDSLMQNDKRCRKLFDVALESALGDKEVSNDEFDKCVGRYSSKEDELFLKRNRIVVGGCSMDDSPRLHALRIAELAGETANWEVFLRAHLDIMNDRFERVSDGNYAWAGRKTYIKELEVLDINVTDLLLGIIFRVDSPSENHYFGSIRRIGRSLAEAQDKLIVEDQMLAMIKDDMLDDYNRFLIYYLFKNYNSNLEDKLKQELNKIKLKKARAFLPEYLDVRD
ncbi:MAG: hypothetical protein BM557_08885 [Flavobacterium sp. MedPE-SWcel]|nr:MAG: hypothetical protein BM557_08885 [Flavobacterium sp. MedPE-SWcel]